MNSSGALHLRIKSSTVQQQYIKQLSPNNILEQTPDIHPSEISLHRAQSLPSQTALQTPPI